MNTRLPDRHQEGTTQMTEPTPLLAGLLTAICDVLDPPYPAIGPAGYDNGPRLQLLADRSAALRGYLSALASSPPLDPAELAQHAANVRSIASNCPVDYPVEEGK